MNIFIDPVQRDAMGKAIEKKLEGHSCLEIVKITKQQANIPMYTYLVAGIILIWYKHSVCRSPAYSIALINYTRKTRSELQDFNPSGSRDVSKEYNPD